MLGFDVVLDESGMILSLPSRFGGGSDGGDGYRVFRRRASKKNGALWRERICARQTVCLRKLGDNRAEKTRLRLFLINKEVMVERMLARQRARIAEHVRDRHILAIQDTSEINYEAKRGRKRGLGTVGNGSDAGPVRSSDADGRCRDGSLLGLGRCAGLAALQKEGQGLPEAADRGQGILSLARRSPPPQMAPSQAPHAAADPPPPRRHLR